MKIVDQSFEIMNTSGMNMIKIIELCARNCYKSEDGITATSALHMVRKLIANNHLPALEFGVMHFEVRASMDRMQEFIQLDLQDQYKYVVFSKIGVEGGVPIFLVTLSLRTLVMCFQKGLKSMIAIDMCHFISHIVDTQIGDPMNLCVRLIDESDLDKYETDHDMDLRRFVYVRIITNRAVTHELVRHRPASYLGESQRYCNYSLGKFNREVTFIRPSAFFQEPSPEYSIWLRAMARAEDYYLRALDYGATPQAARTMLPNSCKTEIIALASIAEWKHIFKLRTSPAAEPSMQEIMKPIAEEFKKRGLI